MASGENQAPALTAMAGSGPGPGAAASALPVPAQPAPPALAGPIPNLPPSGLPAAALPPRPETFGGGFRRGLAGQQYVVDESGRTVPVQAASPTKRGTFGSILAGAVMGAMAGATAARPGGIPSHELGGGFGGGAAAAKDYFTRRDLLARGQAQQNFVNKQQLSETEQRNLNYAAERHLQDLRANKYQVDYDVAKREEPYKAELMRQTMENTAVDLKDKEESLGLIGPPQVITDHDQITKAQIEASTKGDLFVLNTPEGAKVWHTKFDARATPNTTPFEIRTLVSKDPKTGKEKWEVSQTVAPGDSTVDAQMKALASDQTQRNEFDDKEAKRNLEKAQTAQALARARETGGGGDKLLNPSEAAQLGVPYGTTRSGAFGKIPRRPLTTQQIQTTQTNISMVDNALAVLDKIRPDIDSFTGADSAHFQAALNAEREAGRHGLAMSEYNKALIGSLPEDQQRMLGTLLSGQELVQRMRATLPGTGGFRGREAFETLINQLGSPISGAKASRETLDNTYKTLKTYRDTLQQSLTGGAEPAGAAPTGIPIGARPVIVNGKTVGYSTDGKTFTPLP